MTSVINHWINGELQPSTSERYGDVFNPATGEVSASVTMGNSDDLEKAVESASKAFETWSQTSVTNVLRFSSNTESYLNQIEKS